MDPLVKDIVDIVSKLGGLVTVIVGVVMARNQIIKFRDHKGRELEKKERDTKIQQALFWLELRKLFAEHEEVHRMLLSGEWPTTSETKKEPSTDELAALGAYIGLFEFCKSLLDDGLINPDIFKINYEYRVVSILTNETVLKEFFQTDRNREGWKQFISLAELWGHQVPKLA